MGSLQTLTEAERRIVAVWAADCAEQVLAIFEAEAPSDSSTRSGIERARAYGLGELSTAGEIRRRFEAGRASHLAISPAAPAAARSAGQASSVAHMGAHAFGAAAYAAKAASIGVPDPESRRHQEVLWQLAQMNPEVRTALRKLPLIGENASGPLGPGLLSRGVLGESIRQIQADLTAQKGGIGAGPLHPGDPV